VRVLVEKVEQVVDRVVLAAVVFMLIILKK
jgi:hypothetical protein